MRMTSDEKQGLMWRLTVLRAGQELGAQQLGVGGRAQEDFLREGQCRGGGRHAGPGLRRM